MFDTDAVTAFKAKPSDKTAAAVLTAFLKLELETMPYFRDDVELVRDWLNRAKASDTRI